VSGPDKQLGVVVAVDGSPASNVAARWAARAAAIRTVPLTLVHAVVTPTATWLPGLLRDSLRVRLEIEGKKAVTHAMKIAEEAMPSDRKVPIARKVEHSSPAPALIKMSDRAEMIVVGSSGRELLAQGVLGSVSSTVARHANCPVAVIRDEDLPGDLPDLSHAPVLVGVDGSPTSELATAIAFDEASRRGVDLVAFYAWSDVAVSEFAGSRWEALEGEAQRCLAERLAGWQERYPDVTVNRLVVCDRPARQLVEKSQSAQLVVVGGGMLVGSVSNAVLHCVRIPVIVARPPSASGPTTFADLVSPSGRREFDDMLAAKSKSALLQRLEGLPEDEQYAILLDLVRSNIATVLRRTGPEAIDPDRALQELGVDSLRAVEMSNLLKSATGLALLPTLIFDYPKPAELAGYMHRELVGTSGQAAPAAMPGESEIQRVVGSIPVRRLREAGVLELLLALANESRGDGQTAQYVQSEAGGLPSQKSIADMDLDDLVNTALLNDDE
jgi:nucleotide-binding universal stress UspA family protein/acyl carrier protein